MPPHSSFVIRHSALGFVIALFLLSAALPAFGLEVTSPPSGWAQAFNVEGIGNCYQVSTNLYRGAQPTAEGMKNLQAMGVRFIVNLRYLHSDEHVLQGTKLKSMNLAMVPWHPETDKVVKFLKAVTNTNHLPVFVHCERGADRTGLMCAMYRVAVCGWTKEAAIAEMREGGFHFSPVWHQLVEFIEQADIPEIRRRAGLQGTT